MNYLALPQSLVTLFNLADRVATCATAAADRAIAVWSFLTQPQAIATYRWLGYMALALVELTLGSCLWAYAQVAKRFEPRTEIAFDYSAYTSEVSDAIAKLTDEELEAEFNALVADELPGMWGASDFLGGATDCQPAQEHLAGRIDKVMERKAAQSQAMTPAIATCKISYSHPHIAVAIASDDQMMRLAPSTSHEDSLDREYELADLTVKQLVPIAAKLNLPTRKVRKADLIDSILHAEDYQR